MDGYAPGSFTATVPSCQASREGRDTGKGQMQPQQQERYTLSGIEAE